MVRRSIKWFSILLLILGLLFPLSVSADNSMMKEKSSISKGMKIERRILRRKPANETEIAVAKIYSATKQIKVSEAVRLSMGGDCFIGGFLSVSF